MAQKQSAGPKKTSANKASTTATTKAPRKSAASIRRRNAILAQSLDEIAAIDDPVKRALAAKEAYDAHSEIAIEFSNLRRQTIAYMHKDLKMPHKEIAKKLGLTVVATSALAGKADPTKRSGPNWWKRVPDEISEQLKRGPGGLLPEDFIANQEAVEAMLRSMKASAKGRPEVTHRPADLRAPIERRLRREVPDSTIRQALRHGIDQGLIVRVNWGEYAPTEEGNKPAAERRRAAQQKEKSRA